MREKKQEIIDQGMRVLITGGQGMLGQAVQRLFAAKATVVAPGRQELDIRDAAAVAHWLQKTQPDWVLHLAALTNVDYCQQEPELALQVNTRATETLVAACHKTAAGLLFMSSIAVFDGTSDQPYVETDQPRPVNQYGCTKWWAEQAVATLPRHLIVRSGWLFGGAENDKKFVRKIWHLAETRPELAVVEDKVGSPTYVDDLASGLWRLVVEARQGLFHLVNGGPPVSRYALAQEIVVAAGLETAIRPVSSDHFPALAPRPDMEAAASHFTQGWLRPWPAALRQYIAQLHHSA
jgi:dTDP-4-dehydrorhamnose reductase